MLLESKVGTAAEIAYQVGFLRPYGYALFKQGDYEQALATLKKAQEQITIEDRFIYGDPPKITTLIAEEEEAIASQQ